MREVLRNILIKFGLHLYLDKLIKMFLNGTYRKFRTDKYSCNVFAIQNGLKYGDSFQKLLFNFALEYAIMKIEDMRKD
jgi:hypothetical protein